MAEQFNFYTPLEALRDAHLDLMKRQAHDGDSTAFLDDCEKFVERARMAGAFIDADRDRMEAQSLLNYWATRLIRAGRNPGDVALVAFDIEQSPELPDEVCPYLGLAAFLEADQSNFFGREALAQHMLTRLRHGDRLLAVVGASGSGKSSLVLASLLPQLKASALPGSDAWRYAIMVPGSDPVTALRVALGEASSMDAATPLVIVIDQFEETFTLCPDERQREAFVRSILSLIEAHDTENIVVLTLRTDYVDNVARMPALWRLIRTARVDVEAMGADDLRAAIERPAERAGLKFADGIVDDLVSAILGERAGLPLLQFTLLKLWKMRRRDRITWEVYRDVGNPRVALEKSADAFYNSLLLQDKDAARQILLKMVRPAEGLEFTSNRIPRAAIFINNVSADRVNAVLDQMIRQGLVKESTGAAEADTQIEVAHEALVRNWPLLVSWLNDERSALHERFRLADAARRWRDRDREAALLLRGRPLEEAERVAGLAPAELEFVQASRAAQDVEQRAREEAERYRVEQAEVLAREQKLRADRETTANAILRQKVRQLRVALGAVGGLVLTAVALAGLMLMALQARQQAQDAADAKATAAAQASAKAQVANEQAESARATADSEAKRASGLQAQSAELQQKNERAQALVDANQKRARSIGLAATSRSLVDSVDAVRGALVALEAMALTPTVEAGAALQYALSKSPLILLSGAHTQPVRSAAFFPDGTRIATVGADGVLAVWAARTARTDDASRPLQIVDHLTNAVGIDVQVGTDGIWTMSTDGVARLYATGDIPITRTAAITLASSDIGHAEYSAAKGQIVTAGADGVVRVWDASTGEQITKLTGHAGPINRARFIGNGDEVVTAGSDGTARIWDVAAGQVLTVTPSVSNVPLADAQVSPDGAWVATASDDGLVRLWALTQSQPARPTREFSGHDLPINSVQFSPDGASLLSAGADGTVRLWHARSGGVIAVLRGHSAEVGGVNDARFSPDGTRIATAGDDAVAAVWNAHGDTLTLDLAGHSASVMQAHFSPDGTRLLSAGADGTARLWDAVTGQMLGQTQPLMLTSQDDQDNTATLVAGINDVQFSPEGNQFVTAGSDGIAVLWDAATVSPVLTLTGQLSDVWTTAFTPDGDIWTASADGTARLWDAATGAQKDAWSFADGAGQRKADARPQRQQSDKPFGARLSPDGRWLAVRWPGNAIQVLDTSDRKVIGMAEGDDATFSRDGERLLTTSLEQDNAVLVFDLSSLKRLSSWVAPTAASAAFSPDGEQIATASKDGRVRLWRVADGAPLGEEIALHQGLVNSVQFSPDGARVLSAGADGRVRVHAFLPVRPDALIAVAKEHLAGQSLTCDEQGQYLGERGQGCSAIAMRR